MGYMVHHAIVVTCWSEGNAERARAEALRCFGPVGVLFDGGPPLGDCLVSPIIHSPVNGYYTFLVGPDGSKEGWKPSDQGDAARAAFIAWLEAQRYEDHSSPIDWAEVQYGDEDGDDRLLGHS